MLVNIVSWRDIYSIVFPIVGLVILSWGIWWTRPKKEQVGLKTEPKRKQAAEQPTVTTLLERKYADWMTTALNQDNNKLKDCLYVSEPSINFAPLRETDSYFIVTYDIRSSSIYILDIGKHIEGHLRYKSEPMERMPEVISPIEHMERSSTKQLKLRQWVSQSRMNQVGLDGGREIYLIFSDVTISVEAKFPDGSSGPKFSLPIQDKLRIKMPTRVELESQ